MISHIRSIGSQDSGFTQGKLAFLLRLAVHILLAMKDLNIELDQDGANEIISEYVHALMEYHVVVISTYAVNCRMNISHSMHINYLMNWGFKHMRYT
jgi:hypothetical protein